MANPGEPTYGGCEGPEAQYVKLISSDGHEFVVKRHYALTSGTIKAMLSGPGNNLLVPEFRALHWDGKLYKILGCGLVFSFWFRKRAFLIYLTHEKIWHIYFP